MDIDIKYNNMKKKTFWSDEAHIHFHRNKGEVVGGYYFRAFDLIKFMKLIEEEEGEVVGLEFEDNNVNVIIKDEPYIDAYRKTNKADGKAE